MVQIERNNFIYLILALGFNHQEREMLLKDIDIADANSLDKLQDKIIDYIDNKIGKQEVDNKVKDILKKLCL